MLENLIFLSYRREDSAPIALAIKMKLESELRAATIFLDTHHIQVSDLWESEIETALHAAKVFIPLIGPKWAGEDSRKCRRIDDPEDWVRREVEFALRTKSGRILPLLVNDGEMLSDHSLPVEIRGLAAIQALRIDLAFWEDCTTSLLRLLSDQFGFAPKLSRFRFPRPDPLVSKTISVPWQDLESQVNNHLLDWTVEFSEDPDRLNHKRIELSRIFEFNSFGSAIAFINSVAEHAHNVDHHPSILNVWRNVKISLSTWDAGHRVTALDIEFARYLDRTYKKLRKQ